MGFDELVGKRIKAARIDAKRTLLVFETEEGAFSFSSEGDCCSRSWFEHAENVAALAGGVVQSAEEVDLPDAPELPEGHDEYGECIKVYGYEIKTDRGTCRLDMRNASNGYYGGWVTDGVPYRGGLGALRPLEADF